MKLERRIKVASSGFFVFSLMSLVNLAIPDPQIRFLAPIVALISVGLGFLTLKLPIFSTGLGSLVFCVVFPQWIVGGFRTGIIFQNPLGFGLTTLMLTYMVFVLVQGLFAGIILLIEKRKLLKT